jgi:hypothetical protein
MVPGHPISVSVCEVDGGKWAPGPTWTWNVTQRTVTSEVERFTSALGALRTGPLQGDIACKQDGQLSPGYTLLFGYAEGPPVNVSVDPNCRPAIQNGNLQASDPTTVVPLIQELLHPR